MFMRLQMNHHVLKSGKTIGNIDHHTVPTRLVKARRFLDDVSSENRLVHLVRRSGGCFVFMWQEKADSVTMCWH